MKAALPLLLLPVLLLPCCQAAPVNAVVKVDLYPAEANIDAGYQDQYFAFNGTVSVDDSLERELTVILQPVMTYPLGGSCSPDYVVFTGSGAAVFKCTVKVPAKTNNVTSAVFVNAQAHYRLDIVGTNQSPLVNVIVGALPPPDAKVDDFYFGYPSGSIGLLPAIIALAVVVAALSAFLFVRRRRKTKAAGRRAS